MRFGFTLLLALGVLLPAANANPKVSPVVECVGQDPDGSYFAWFGYDNRDTVPVTIPTGSGSTAGGAYSNRFTSGGALGQPTVFLPGRQQYVFRISLSGGNTWVLRRPGAGQSTAAVGSNASSASCPYERSGADLSLAVTISDPAPEVGDIVTAQVTVSNAGPQTPRNVTVGASGIPTGVTLLSSSATSGSTSGTTWTVGSWGLGPNVSQTLTLELRVDSPGSFSIPFQILSSSIIDPDSQPGNASGTEDDEVSVAISQSTTSSGNNGGLESDGRLATLLARRSVERTRQRAEAARLGLATAPLVPLASSPARRSAQGSLDLASVLPTTAPGGLTGYVTTPEDLLRVTNATAILSADYLQDDGDRAGAVLALLTPAGEVYDHTKAICDRVTGSRLESVRRIEVAGADFVLLHVSRPDGTVDYAISLVASPSGPGGSYLVDSRFRSDEYQLAATGDGDVLNVQAWAATPDLAVALAERVLDSLSDQVEIDFRNRGIDAPALPDVYARSGSVEPGALALDLVNTTGQTVALTLQGSVAATEEGDRTSFSHTLTVPASGLQTRVPLANAFDIDLDLSALGAISDRLYLADGAWTYTSGDASDDLAFSVEAGGIEASDGVRPVERSARLAGTAREWAGLFRVLLPGERAVDLSAYDALAFEGRGTGRVQVVIEQAGDEGVFAWADLSENAETHVLPFDAFQTPSGERSFTGEGVSLVSFYSYTEGGAPAPFEMDLRGVRFEAARAVSTEPELPEALALSVAPNPSRGAARLVLALAEAEAVTVEVIDILGRRVAVVAQGESLSAGEHSLALPSDLAAGAYVVNVRTRTEARAIPITRL
ncbi:MAG: T9SS type A sorting domain-containing protein [Bacteroidota bacterium]